MTEPFGPSCRADHVGSLLRPEHLSLAPKCGFASLIGGNLLSEDNEAAKFACIVEVAREVWSDV